jgi:cytochrome c peroxidase
VRLPLAGLLSLLTLGVGGCAPEGDELVQLRALVTAAELTPLAPAPVISAEKLALGRALFFDPELSGNRDQSCSSCHHPEEGMGDGRSLSVGTASVIRDGARVPGPDHSFVPRNAPALFNLADPALVNLFWDGRVQAQGDGFVLFDVGYDALGLTRELPSNLESLLAAQAMLPVLVRDELRGEAGEQDASGQTNELALIDGGDFDGIWAAVIERLLAIDAYASMLQDAYPEVPQSELHFAHAANAIAAFLGARMTLVGSPWDRFLVGEDAALSPEQVRGALLFYREAACSTCHEGSMLSDQLFHNIGVRPMGSGPSDLEHVDYGAAHRSHVGNEARFAFRTRPLREVAVSGPWMHNGCYTDLEAVVRHHLDPLAGLYDFDTEQLSPEFHNQVHDSDDVLAQVEETISEDVLGLPDLSDEEVGQLLAFLEALTSPGVDDLVDEIPDSVPSGLPLVGP